MAVGDNGYFTWRITLQGTTDSFTSDNLLEKVWIVLCCVDELTTE
jgi:hypothetical protein